MNVTDLYYDEFPWDFFPADSLHCERKFERSRLSARCGGLPCVSLSLCRVNLRMCICWSNEIVSYNRQNRKKHVHPRVVNYRTNFFSSSCSKWNLVLKRWLLQWIREEMLETFQMHFFHQIALSSKIRNQTEWNSYKQNSNGKKTSDHINIWLTTELSALIECSLTPPGNLLTLHSESFDLMSKFVF